MEEKEIPLILRNKVTGQKYGVLSVSFDASGIHKNDTVVLRNLEGNSEVTTCRRASLFEIYTEPEGVTSVYPLNARKIVIETTSSAKRDRIYVKLRKILLEGK